MRGAKLDVLLMALCVLLLFLSFFTFLVVNASAQGPEEYPPEGVALTDYDELTGIEGYQYLGMEDEAPTLGASGYSPPSSMGGSDQLNGADSAELLEHVRSIRESADLFVYGVVPVLLAGFLLFKICLWFYSAFIKSAIGR